MRRPQPFVLALLVLALGCGGAESPGEQTEVVGDLAPDDPSILMRPFSDEEIRDEWVPGFRLLMRRTFPEGSRVERWTVVSADKEGVEIEYATILDNGSVEGEPTIVRSRWVELRDHASFPAAHSTREWTVRETALGNFDGWLYRVADPDAAVVNEFFFVPELPGAPVHMRTLEGDATVFELEQTVRLRPDTD